MTLEMWNEFESGRAPVWSESGGGVPLHLLALKAPLVVLVSVFVMISTVLSVSCLLFFYSRCPRAQPSVKVERQVPPVPHGAVPLS